MIRCTLSLFALTLLLGCNQAVDTGQVKATPASASQGDAASEATASSGATADSDSGAVTTISFEVPGMSCPYGCAPRVKEALESVPGVVQEIDKDADIDLETKIAKVRIDKAKYNIEAALNALQKAGFDDASVKN